MRNMGYGGKHCLDAPADKSAGIIVYPCHSSGGTQFWEYEEGLLRKDDQCIEFNKHEIKLVLCKPEDKQHYQVRNHVFNNLLT